MQSGTHRGRVTEEQVSGRLGRVGQSLEEHVDGASLGLFRAGFGVLVAVSAARFFLHGWIGKYYGEPRVFFSYYGFSWVRPLPSPGMPIVYALLALFGIGLAVGKAHRIFGVLTFLTFTYAHLCDKTNYLNHYYLFSLLAFLLTIAPAGSEEGSLGPRRVRRLWVVLFRFQVGCVYVGGGLAKLTPDWLLHAQPLSIWLSSNTEMFLVGPLFASKSTAYAMSWAGALFDLSIPFLLLFRRTRTIGYVGVLFFHLLTARLFQLGMFPWAMMFASLLFLPPSFPRHVPGFGQFFLAVPHAPGTAKREVCTPDRVPARCATAFSRSAAVGILVYAVIQVALPLRHFSYPGNLLWTEEGLRFSWNVMVMEKDGALELSVREATTGRVHVVEPHDYLTPQQAKMTATQPDMILQFAQFVRADFARRGMHDVEVYASQSDVSLNGRAAVPLVDPLVDLARVEESLTGKAFVLPAPTAKPLF